MLELIDRKPEFDVLEAEYLRLLGFPADYRVAGRVRELTAWARQWYRDFGEPWWYVRQAEGIALANGTVTIDGMTFVSGTLYDSMRRAGANSAVCVAVSAGGECEAYARRLWEEGKPDEYLFLEVFGSAVVEALVAAVAHRLCEWADRRGVAVLPHYSPGYPDWNIGDQRNLFDHIASGSRFVFRDRVRVMTTGMLQPKKSLLAVFGITAHVERVRRLTSLVPCDSCALSGCQYRRAPYRHPLPRIEGVRAAPEGAESGAGGSGVPSAVLTPSAAYSFGLPALEKWSRERLQLRALPDRTIEARFRYDGTTCSNLGRPLAFLYHIRLSSAEDGHAIIDARCAPAPEDTGHTYMCEYLEQSDALLDTIAAEQPLVGRPLDDVLRWSRDHDPAGCYCDAAARAHKWGLVLEVLHFALATSVVSETARLPELLEEP